MRSMRRQYLSRLRKPRLMRQWSSMRLAVLEFHYTPL